MERSHGRRPVERRRLRWEDNIWMDCLIGADYKWPEGTDRGLGHVSGGEVVNRSGPDGSVAPLTKKDEMYCRGLGLMSCRVGVDNLVKK
jgi:hypothetical protein